MNDLSKCPVCNGEADNGHDRSDPPSAYYCTKCQAKEELLTDDEVDKVIDACEEPRILNRTCPSCEKWKAENKLLTQGMSQAHEIVEETEAENKKLRKFAMHNDSCKMITQRRWWNQKCTCGLEKALKE